MKNLTAHVLSVGEINIGTGITGDSWSIYENQGLYAFLTHRSSLLLACKDTFEVGDIVNLRGNDSQRKLRDGDEIVDLSPCTKDELVAMLLKNKYDYRPIKAFRARPKGNRKLNTSYSVKGTEFTK